MAMSHAGTHVDGVGRVGTGFRTAGGASVAGCIYGIVCRYAGSNVLGSRWTALRQGQRIRAECRTVAEADRARVIGRVERYGAICRGDGEVVAGEGALAGYVNVSHGLLPFSWYVN